MSTLIPKNVFETEEGKNGVDKCTAPEPPALEKGGEKRKLVGSAGGGTAKKATVLPPRKPKGETKQETFEECWNRRASPTPMSERTILRLFGVDDSYRITEEAYGRLREMADVDFCDAVRSLKDPGNATIAASMFFHADQRTLGDGFLLWRFLDTYEEVFGSAVVEALGAGFKKGAYDRGFVSVLISSRCWDVLEEISETYPEMEISPEALVEFVEIRNSAPIDKRGVVFLAKHIPKELVNVEIPITATFDDELVKTPLDYCLWLNTEHAPEAILALLDKGAKTTKLTQGIFVRYLRRGGKSEAADAVDAVSEEDFSVETIREVLL